MASRRAAQTVAEHWVQRTPERRMLLSAMVAILLGWLMLLGAKPKDGLPVETRDLAPLLFYVLAFASAHGALVLARFRGDQLVVPLAAALSGIGLMAQQRMGLFDSASGATLEPLTLPAGVAVLLAVGIGGAGGRYRLAARGLWGWAVLSLLVLALVLMTGQRYRGAVFGLGFITPTEVLKLTMVLFTAAFVDRHSKVLGRWNSPFPPLRALWPLLAVWSLLLALLLLQRDLGLVLILALALVAMLGAGARHLGYPLYGVALGGAGGWALLALFSHGQRRVEAWLDPFADPTGAGWQVLQGLSGMYAGGLWGEGFSEARPRYTPIAESDFIYAVIAEELGYAGGLLLVVLLALLLVRLIEIAARARTCFGVTLASGIATVLSAQTLLNLGGVTKTLPLTGITLPLISHGGSSLLTVLASLGLMLAISDGEPVARRAGGSGSRAPKQARPRARVSRGRASRAGR